MKVGKNLAECFFLVVVGHSMYSYKPLRARNVSRYPSPKNPGPKNGNFSVAANDLD